VLFVIAANELGAESHAGQSSMAHLERLA
jgi:hypothetical protein